MIRDIGNIGNYYGSLKIKDEDGKFYWSIENYDGEDWEEIGDVVFDTPINYYIERRWNILNLFNQSGL